MNQTIKDILSRRSIRRFKPEPLPRDLLAEIITAGEFAPTALNTQSLHFSVILNQDIIADISAVNKKIIGGDDGNPLKKLAQMDNFCNFYHAPAVIIISSDDIPYGVADAANAAENICIAAQSLGIGSCYIASFLPAFASPEAPRLKDRIMLPENKIVRFAVALGYIDGETPSAPPRRENNITVID